MIMSRDIVGKKAPAGVPKRVIEISVELGSDEDATPPPLLQSIWDDSNDNRHALLRQVPKTPYHNRNRIKGLKVRSDDAFYYLGLSKKDFYTRTEAELASTVRDLGAPEVSEVSLHSLH